MVRAIASGFLLTLGGAACAAVTVNVDVNQDRRLIHPEIYGMNYGTAAQLGALKVPVRRWGGNSTTRYNWQKDIHSTAGDYYWENIPDSQDRSQVPPLGNSADTFVDEIHAAGGAALVTIPTIGWKPRDDSPLAHPYFAGFKVSKYGAQVTTDFWDPDAGDGECEPAQNPSANCVEYTDYTGTHHHLVNNDPTDTSAAADPAYFAGWIAHFVAKYGNAAGGGVRWYALDNESMLWNSTHRDVHPLAPTYAEIWGKAQGYGAAIKNADPTALVTGPVTWGYPDLFTSAKDAEDCNCSQGNDRNAHGGMPFVAWYLQQVCANPLPAGKRLVDVLDLHYYPQGGESLSNDESAATAALRLRSIKELYSASYRSESWIGGLDGPGGDDPDNHYPFPNLLPRVQAWIDAYCPGTGIAITEYNWGGDNDGSANADNGVSAALAQAEALAIFGRERVVLATRWGAPKPGSAVETAFKLFLNYDNATFARVIGYSTRATSSSVDTVGAYAVDLPRQRTMLLLFNKSTSAQTLTLNLAQHYTGTWKLYRFADDGTNPAGFGVTALAQAATGSMSNAQTISNATLNTLPARSASLLVLPPPSDSDVIFVDGYDGQ